MAKAKKPKAKPKAKKKAKPKAEKVKKQVKEEEKVEGKEVGKITHYFGNISVAVVELSGALKVGDKIRIKGATTDFTQEVGSMQIEHENVETAGKGDAVGLKVKDKVRDNDKVYVL
jgi:putative protease